MGIPPIAFYYPLANGQADPGSRILSILAGQAFENAKDFVVKLGRNPDSVVLNREFPKIFYTIALPA
jgi:hypothetical protein